MRQQAVVKECKPKNKERQDKIQKLHFFLNPYARFPSVLRRQDVLASKRLPLDPSLFLVSRD